ncbi:transglutaminase-like superfamily protein [Terrimicrobium sacchariphilum]|uniref:Transglutaminase-like superfamily protein n=1 Tax=Terrimicrobium sacchariphilum TaxID=690879 RepID=A0A146G7W2_TERSA|nr:transglutaminaseTgpA domain-containing protein [Terrimicrobium sacchariphilum]GAT33004.1 transglutaminase-like superfamily protein [Terrimicrobium sacchariphilum]
MNEVQERRERHLGWVLAGALTIHLIILVPRGPVMLAALAALLTGAILRQRQTHLPAWLVRVALVLGAIGVFIDQDYFRLASTLGDFGAIVGALLLLRPVTPQRGMRVLLCMLVLLASAILRPYPTVGATFVVIDVIVFLLLAEQIHRPAEATVSLWVAVSRSLRVVVPVGIIVTAIFWAFPNLSDYSPKVWSGFSGSGVLNPGSIAEVAQSRRVALVARFAPNQEIPKPSELYWRGQVLEVSGGMTWARFSREIERDRLLLPSMPPSEAGHFHYRQELAANRSGIVAVLDHALYVSARRDDQDVVVMDLGGSVLQAVGGGQLAMDVVSTSSPMPDAPLAALAEGSLTVPKNVRNDPKVKAVLDEIFRPSMDTPARMQAVAKFFRKGGFRYTQRPGRTDDLGNFLTAQKRGFCEHYAAAGATLLRLGGVPARIVTGYRGGTWNPWMRTITVRDSDAHAWVEAWDSSRALWVRFDPTDFVAPQLAGGIAREMDSSMWPWYRTGASYLAATVATSMENVEEAWSRLTSSQAWEHVDVMIFIALVGIAFIWLLRNLRARRSARSENRVERLLVELEDIAARAARNRQISETPLAWLKRLEATASEEVEKDAIRQFSDAYEEGAYRESHAVDALVGRLKALKQELRRLWRRPAAVSR